LKVYLDGVLRIEATDSVPLERVWDPSDEFFLQIGAYCQTCVDNLTANNEILLGDTTTTTTTPPATTTV
jgi:hypothetical protein